MPDISDSQLQAAADAPIAARLHVVTGYDGSPPATRGARHDAADAVAGLEQLPGHRRAHNCLEYLAEAVGLLARGEVTPMVEAFSKENINEAVAKAASGDVRFKAVVTY